MHKSQSLFNLTTALHVSGVAITHLQEHKTTVTTASGNRYTVLLSAAIVEELELIKFICFLYGLFNDVVTGFSFVYLHVGDVTVMQEVKILDNLVGPDGCLLHYYSFLTIYSFKGIGIGKSGRIVKLTSPLHQISRFRSRGCLGCTKILYTFSIDGF